MGEDYDWEEEWVGDLKDAGFEVFDTIYDVGGGRALAVAGCDACIHGV